MSVCPTGPLESWRDTLLFRSGSHPFSVAFPLLSSALCVVTGVGVRSLRAPLWVGAVLHCGTPGTDMLSSLVNQSIALFSGNGPLFHPIGVLTFSNFDIKPQGACGSC